MPKKTFKQKVLADRHKEKILTLEQPTYSFAASPKVVPTTGVSPVVNTSRHIFNDIRKTVFISIIFITLEILLAFFSKKFGL